MISNKRWMFVLPPYGAARLVAIKTADAFLEKVGPQVFWTFDTLNYLQSFSKLLTTYDENLVTDLTNQSLIVSCFDFEITHLITTALCPVTLFTLGLLRKHNISTIHWFYEDYRRALYWKDVISGYDHFCSIQKSDFQTICQTYKTKYHFLSTASSFQKTDSLQNQKIKYDLAFIGIPSTYRICFLEKLLSEGFRIIIAGSGWQSYSGPLENSILYKQWTNDTQMKEIFLQSRIGLNLSVEDPTGRADVHISPRVYDIVACGNILLTEDVPLIYDSLPECWYFTFKCVDDACSKIRQLLKPVENESKKIEKNKQIIFDNHTYAHRVEELISFCL